MVDMKTLLLALLFFSAAGTLQAQDHLHRLGLGVNYWVSVDDLDLDGVDNDGLSYVASYQYRPALLGWEVALEFLPDRFGENAVAPQAHLIVGQGVYAAAGAGWVYQDSAFADDPFFSLKAGLNFQILPGMFLDLSGNYRFNEKADLSDEDARISTDTVFLGLALRFSL